MIRGINHVGIVVKNIDEVLSLVREAFGAEEIHRMEVPMMKQISSVVRIGDDCFELMEPTGPDGPAGGFLEAKGARGPQRGPARGTAGVADPARADRRRRRR